MIDLGLSFRLYYSFNKASYLIAILSQALEKYQNNLTEKLNEKNCTFGKSHQVISPLNFLDTVVKKLVSEELSHFWEENKKLHKKQMEKRKQLFVMYAPEIMIHKVNKYSINKEIARALIINVKSAFDHVSYSQHVESIVESSNDDNLIGLI